MFLLPPTPEESERYRFLTGLARARSRRLARFQSFLTAAMVILLAAPALFLVIALDWNVPRLIYSAVACCGTSVLISTGLLKIDARLAASARLAHKNADDYVQRLFNQQARKTRQDQE